MFLVMITETVNMVMSIIISALLISSAFAEVSRADPLGERIVGGTPATIQQFPFIVGMLLDHLGTGSFSQACGGSLLTSRHILSAANCFQETDTQPNRWQIRAGSTFRSSGGTVVAVSRIIIHPQYNNNHFDNDLSVLTLVNNLALGDTIAQASIPNQGYEHPDNAVSFVIGWGSTTIGGNPSEELLRGELHTVNQQTCAQRYAVIGLTVTDATLCAGLIGVGGVDTCQGDSGGPFVYNNVVVGVTSWVTGCGIASFPGIYARVSFFTDWIVSTVSHS